MRTTDHVTYTKEEWDRLKARTSAEVEAVRDNLIKRELEDITKREQIRELQNVRKERERHAADIRQWWFGHE